MSRPRRSRSGSSSLSALSDPVAGRAGADARSGLDDSPRTSETLPLSDLGSEDEEDAMEVDAPPQVSKMELGRDMDDGSDLTDEEEDEQDEDQDEAVDGDEDAREEDEDTDEDEEDEALEAPDEGQAAEAAEAREQEQEEVDEKDAALRAELLIGGAMQSARSSVSGSLSPAPSTGARKLAPLPRPSMSIGGRDPLLRMDGLDASQVLGTLAEERGVEGDEASETLSEPDEEADATMRLEGPPGQDPAEEEPSEGPVEDGEEEGEDTGAEEADDQSHLAAPTRSHSSHAPPPPPAAVRALLKLELQLAEVRNRLHIERMQEAAAEEEMLLNGSHPALRYLWATLSNRRERLHEVSSRRHKQVLEELKQAREAEKGNVWTWWTDRRDALYWDGFEETWSKRRRLAREKNELEQIRIRKPVPRYGIDGGKHLSFDWSGGAAPPALPRDDAARDLALVDQHRRMLLSSRHASPAYYGQTPQYPLGAQTAAGYFYAAATGVEPEKSHGKHHTHNHHLAQRPPAQQSSALPSRTATYSYPPQTQPQSKQLTSAPMPQRNASGSDGASHPSRREGRTVPTNSSELFDPRPHHSVSAQHPTSSSQPSSQPQTNAAPSHAATHENSHGSSGPSSVFGGFWGRADSRVPAERALGPSGSMEARLANGHASRDPPSSPVAPGLYQRKSDGKERDSLADGREREAVPARPASADTAPPPASSGSGSNGHASHSHVQGLSLGYSYRPPQAASHGHPQPGSASDQAPPRANRFPGLAEYLNASAASVPRNHGREGIFALPSGHAGRPDPAGAKRELVSPPTKGLGPGNGLLGGGLGREALSSKAAYGAPPPAQSISSATAAPRS